MSYLAQAIQELSPTAEFSFQNEDYSTVKWDVLDGTAPTLKAINDKIEEIQNRETTEAATKASAKASAMTKLTALGLSEDEAKAIIG
jgi:hypothetical protein